MSEPEDIVDAVAELLDRGARKEALARARAAADAADAPPEAAYALGLVLTQMGRIEEADRAFARAAELDPETYFEPYRLDRESFDRLVEEALAELPPDFRRHLENVEVAVEDVPSLRLLRDEDLGHDLLGLYQGGTIQTTEWGLPDRIVLFQRNLENVSPDRETLVEEVRATVLHEVGHHLGLDEDRLEAIEDEWYGESEDEEDEVDDEEDD